MMILSAAFLLFAALVFSELMPADINKIRLIAFIEIDDISEQLNERQRNALFHLQKNGQIATREYAEINHISPRTAYTELKDLTDKGLLIAVGKGRGIRYVRKVDDQVTD